jgi:uncharacterized protein YkwD
MSGVFRGPVQALATRLLVALVLALGVAIAGPAGAASGPAPALAKCKDTRKHPKNLSSKRAARSIRCLVNRQRELRGAGSLDRKRALGKAARQHSRWMRAARCFAHLCSGEPDLGGRATRSGYLPCGCSWALGENIAQGKDRRGSPRVIVRRWMASSTHRQNLLSGRFRDIGVGVVRGAPGTSSHRSKLFTLTLGSKN